MPFGNKSFSAPEYTGYLSSTQALADYADLIYFLQENNNKSNPVIAFGGSYGGMLSAYFRMKYPHVVAGAIAASAPILQFQGMVPCDVFFRIATSDFKTENKNCSDNIRKSWSTIRSTTASKDGRSWLSNEWKLCSAMKSDNETQGLLDFLNNLYGTLAMVNYPYSSAFMVPLPGHPVREFCRPLHNGSLTGKPLLRALYKAVNLYNNYTGTSKCLNMNPYNPDLGDQGWDYQACTEMVMPMCATGKDDMFEPAAWDEKSFTEECKKKWGVAPQYHLAEKEYGGKRLAAASNIVFSNGLLDPWAGGGVFKNYSRTTPAILIPEGAHHLDLMSANPKDPYSVKYARNFHKENMKQWIKEWNHNDSSKSFNL